MKRRGGRWVKGGEFDVLAWSPEVFSLLLH